MRGELLDVVDVGWQGLTGDRRLAFRWSDDRSGFSWLTASTVPELILFAPPGGREDAETLPTHVRTADGEALAVFSQELAADVGHRHGSPVEMVYLDRGIFDEASVSLISSATVDEIGRVVAQRPGVRRFRPNILIASSRSIPFEDDAWIGGILSCGDANEAAALFITNHDERCSMVTFDPDSARPSPDVLKAIVRVRDNRAGALGGLTRGQRRGVRRAMAVDDRAT